MGSSTRKRAELDDNCNGVPNELFDGIKAGRYNIGTGILLAGDAPIIGMISDSAPIRQSNYSLFVNDVTSTSQIARVSALVFHPEILPQAVNLNDAGGAQYEVLLSGLDQTNLIDTEIAVYAEDVDGNVSLPAFTIATGDILFKNGFD